MEITGINTWKGYLIFAIITILALIGLMVVINTTGNILFPEWWNKTLGT